MITIIGSGIVALTVAEQLIDKNIRVRIITKSKGVDSSLCSWWAGGMLAPFCEMESAEALVGELAPISMQYWQQLSEKTQSSAFTFPYNQKGTLVISPAKDQNQLALFARKTKQWQKIQGSQITELEPLLKDFKQALFYPTEAHIEPRLVLNTLWHRVSQQAEIITDTALSEQDIQQLCKENKWVIDCRGYQARSVIPNLRGVRGEMLHVYHPDIHLSRPIRLLHRRIPIYIVPRENQQFMIGATMIESEFSGEKRASVRSILELLSSAYALNPMFSQAEIVEIGADVRPAYPNNLPKILHHKNRLFINGMHRHGYLLSPAISKIAVDFITTQQPHSLIEEI